MKATKDLKKRRIIESGVIVGGLLIYLVLGLLLPYSHTHWPENFGLADALISFFALLSCVLLLPVMLRGSMAQRVIALAVLLFPAWILYWAIRRVFLLFK